MTEEDVRGKLILPYLEDLGIDISEISLEKGFTIRLGRGKRKTGRSDILCKRHGKNLFIIELKNPNESITQDDVDQGISYARSLLDNIAPFTIISNGKNTKIFDSITKLELSGSKISNQSQFWKNGFILSTEEDIRIRYEALKNFISLSPENLKVFCESQVKDRIGQIIGPLNNSYSKFVIELHYKRIEVQSVFKNFIESNNSLFGIVGDAGVGKTSVMCSLALQSLNKNFTFFYNASIIKSPIECICQDLNITFSNKNETDSILKRLNEIGRYANKKILIFIDAIDENINPNLALELSEIALAVRNLEKIKILISCKSNIWNSILYIKNNPTHLYEELSRTHNGIKCLNNSPAFLLKEFTEKEFTSILPLYQKTFDLKGEISTSLRAELKNGFFLKIFSEVYVGKKVPEKIDDKELIKRYLEKSLEKVDIPYSTGIRILAAIGKVFLKYKYSSWETFKDDGLDTEFIFKKLNLSLNNNFPEDLFTRNILIKSNDTDTYRISFYYSKIRDYIICYHTCKLDKLNDKKFYKRISKFFNNHIGKSALEFYIENAKQSHIETLRRYKIEKGQQYAVNYEDYLRKNFPNLIEKFNPYTKGDIGIILPEDLIKNDGYALLAVDLNTEERVQYESFEDAFFGKNTMSLYEKRGVKTLYGSNSPILAHDHSKVLEKNILTQLEKLLEKGAINIYNSEILLREKLSLIIYFYHKKLELVYNIEEFYLPRFKNIYPINLQDLKIRIKKFKLIEHYKRQRLDKVLITEIVQRKLKENSETPAYSWTGDVPPIEELDKIVDIFIGLGYSEIKEHYLPLPDVSISDAKIFYQKDQNNNRKLIRSFQYSEKQKKEYITDFFKKLEISYKAFVDQSFPLLKKELDFYSTMPHKYFFYSNKFGEIGYGYTLSKSNKIEIEFKNYTDSKEIFKRDRIKFLRFFNLDQLLRVSDYSRFPVNTFQRINTPKLDEYCVIRNWIYKTLKYDLDKKFRENRWD